MFDPELIDGSPEEVVPPKESFRDERMNNIRCPLGCDAQLLLIRAEEHSFGELGFWQCPDCGTTMDLCNMVDKPMQFDLISRIINYEWVGSLRSVLKSHGHFINMPVSVSKATVKSEKENAKYDKLEAQVKCACCDQKFNPAPSAKSILTLEYCAPCRKKAEVRAEVADREAKVKAAAKKARSKSKKVSRKR